MKHRYLFILEVAPVETGKTYGELPSHLTLMSRFFSEISPLQLDRAARPLFERTPALQLTFGEIEKLGPKRLTVHLVNHSSELEILHNELLALVNSLSVEFEYPQFIGTGHKPHVTAREGVKFKADDTLLASCACLVEVIDGRRIIRSKFELGK
jgi:hypothetical protein